MFTEKEVGQLEHVFTLARSFAAQNHGKNFDLMKGLITVQETVMPKIISLVPKPEVNEDLNRGDEDVVLEEIEEKQEEPVTHNED